MPSPLPFAEPSLTDASAVRRVVARAQQSDLAFANVYLLRAKYGTEVALEGGFLFRHFSGHGRLQGYAFPRGSGDVASALGRIEEDAVCRGRALRFCLLLEEEGKVLESFYPGRFELRCDRGDADYVYERCMLAELPGARFHRKRNHIERFVRENPSWCVERLVRERAADAQAVAAGWLAGSSADGVTPPALLHEYEAICRALECMEELGLFGCVLYVDGLPVGMSIGSMLGDEVADVHYEKCLPAFRSAYPLLNRELARQLNCAWVNREEDLNIEGLRKAKLSYFPLFILSKYQAVPC